MAKKNQRSALPFPKEVLIQHAFETGDASSTDESWMIVQDGEKFATANVRTGVYRLVEVVVIQKKETFKRVSSK